MSEFSGRKMPVASADVKCLDCGIVIDPSPSGKGPRRQRCDFHRDLRKAKLQRARFAQLRAEGWGVVADLVFADEVFERDQWVCHLCGKTVPEQACACPGVEIRRIRAAGPGGRSRDCAVQGRSSHDGQLPPGALDMQRPEACRGRPRRAGVAGPATRGPSTAHSNIYSLWNVYIKTEGLGLCNTNLISIKWLVIIIVNFYVIYKNISPSFIFKL